MFPLDWGNRLDHYVLLFSTQPFGWTYCYEILYVYFNRVVDRYELQLDPIGGVDVSIFHIYFGFIFKLVIVLSLNIPH